MPGRTTGAGKDTRPAPARHRDCGGSPVRRDERSRRAARSCVASPRGPSCGMTNFIRLDPATLPAFPRHLDAYRELVDDVEDGYLGGLSDYVNDLYCRSAIQAELDAGLALSAEYQAQLRDLDERLKRLLLPARASIHGDAPRAHFWFHGVPSTATEVVRDALGLALLEGGSPA